MRYGQIASWPATPNSSFRGRLIRSLDAVREMLPGSFVERRRACGKPNCRCASGHPLGLHPEWVLSVLWAGKLRTTHLSRPLAEQARRGVQLHRRFQEIEQRICALNLRRLLRQKQDRKAK